MTPSQLDNVVTQEITRIEWEVEKWVRSKDLWGDCGFMNFIDHKDAEPWSDHPVVTIFGSEGDFNNIFCGYDELLDDFSTMLNRNGYWFERDTCIVYVLSANAEMNENFKDYFRWQWVCSFLQPDFNDVHHELFQYFSEDPKSLERMNWREFEFLIYELFRRQDYKVELGPGQGDGGIDMTLLQTDPIGDIMTAVQVKRYHPSLPIKLQAVQALHGAAVANRFQRSTFVTTSRYLPSARKFAQRENVCMDLFLSNDVIQWCESAHRGIVEDKKKLISRESIERHLLAARSNPRDYVVHATTGCSIQMNSFALKLKEAKHGALLLELPKIVISHDGHGMRGLEVPNLDASAVSSAISEPAPFGEGRVIRAKKYFYNDCGYRFWTGENGYLRWNGEPKEFDLID